MNTGTDGVPEAGCRETRLRLLREALAALEAGDTEAYRRHVVSLADAQQHELKTGVVELARRVHRAISELNLDSRLASMAESDLPDARSNLDHVVHMTEQAAHRTLDLVEESRALLDDMGRHQHALMMNSAALNLVAVEAAPMAAHADAVTGGMSRLRVNLSALAQAQEYQDISGQLIRRVIGLVEDIESALVDLLKAAGVDLKNCVAEPITSDSGKLLGPAAKQQASQQDADSLLANLGF